MGKHNPFLLIALALAPAAIAAPASAQCRLCTEPTTNSESAGGEGSVSLSVDTSLDFDQLVLLGTGEGTATLSPDGSRSVSGLIGSISGRAMVGTAQVRGEPGRAIRITMPRQIELHSASGNRIAIEEIVSDLPTVPRLDSAGKLTFRFGGRLKISGDAEGDYRGDVPINAEYQ